jgi:hypothetical protein
VLQKLRQLAVAILARCSRLVQTFYCASLDISPPFFWTNTHTTLNFTDTFLSLLQRSIAHLNVPLHVKHVQKLTSERDPILRAEFVRRIGRYPTDYLISLDEVSKDERTYS